MLKIPPIANLQNVVGNEMRALQLIAVLLLFSVCVQGQIDTLRQDYNNGSPQFIYPTLDSQYHGNCKQWFPNGQLWSEGNWITGKQDGLQVTYFENGAIQMKSWYKSGAIAKSKLYHANGKKSLFSWTSTNSGKQYFWYESGKKLIKERYKNGHPITCSSAISLDTTPSQVRVESCYCGVIPVFWKDSVYVDSAGNPVNLDYNYQSVEWFESGPMKSKTEYKKGKGYRKEWDANGNLIIEEELPTTKAKDNGG